MDPQAFLNEALINLGQSLLVPGGMIPGVNEALNTVRRTPVKALVGQDEDSQAKLPERKWDRDADPGEQFKRTFLEKAGDTYFDRDPDKIADKAKRIADQAELKHGTNYYDSEGKLVTGNLSTQNQRLTSQGMAPIMPLKDGRTQIGNETNAQLRAKVKEGAERLQALEAIDALGETPQSLGLDANSTSSEMRSAIAKKNKANAAGKETLTHTRGMEAQQAIDDATKERTQITADANVEAQNIASQATITSANINANSSERTTAMTLNANSKNAALDRQQSNSQFLATLKDTAQSRIESNQLALAQLRAQMEQSRRADERADRRDERRDRLDLLQILTQGAQGLANGIGAGFIRY